ncbi:unnamed protein product [Alopecurus aequalis]
MSARRDRRCRRRAKAEAEAALSKLREEEEESRRILHMRVLRRSLQGQIRCYYLDAISRLPTADLNTTLARGLLVAGHCYGPLHPVDNILLNSIWYSAAFPLRPEDRIDAAVINRTIIIRLVQRSLDGLVASLRHHCPGLSEDDALWHLSLSGADLRAAVASARGAAPSLLRLTESEAEAAAKAARHPKPAAFALFASSVIPSVQRDAVSLLNNNRRLSSADILRLSAMLLPSPLPYDLPHPPLRERFTTAFKLIARRRRLLIRWYREWAQLADTALRKYAQQTGEHYQLHIIYAIGGLQDEFNMDEAHHISLIAWPKDPSSCASTREAPVFFFAEALVTSGSEYSQEDITLCCIVQPSPADVDSCQACLAGNFQVDHPDDSEKFDGGQYYDMDAIGKDLHCPIESDVDYRCFDPDRDIDFVEYLDQDFIRYTSASPWHRRHKDDIDSAINYYCIRY